MPSHDILILGGGVFGVTAAWELHARGYVVALLDQGPIPHPEAASTDINKVVRMEYGSDKEYMALADEAITGWHAWNERYGETLYHETGVALMTRAPMAPGAFDHQSYQNLLARGRKPERLDGSAIAVRFPAWKDAGYVDGFFHARGGFTDSGLTVATLARDLRRLGVAVHEGAAVVEILRDGARVTGVRCRDGSTYLADQVVVCAGAWTPYLVPELRPMMRATGHPVFHLRPDDPALFAPPQFVTFLSDVSRSGWYGFPLHPSEGVVKVARHSAGLELDPSRDRRVVTEEDHSQLREFLEARLPALASAEVVFTRRCLYCDTLDGHFWIDRHPGVEGLTVAAGGSGHAMKMAPMLGGIIADALEKKPNRWLPRFAWRTLSSDTVAAEESRLR